MLKYLACYGDANGADDGGNEPNAGLGVRGELGRFGSHYVFMLGGGRDELEVLMKKVKESMLVDEPIGRQNAGCRVQNRTHKR